MANCNNPRAMSKEEVDSIRPDMVRKVLSSCGVHADGYPFILDLDRSKGVWLVDAVSGRRILDGFSFFATWALGQNHPKMSDPAFTAKLLRAAQHNPPNADVYTVEFAQFVATFRRVLVPEGFVHLFFIAGGGPAVGNAIKCAVDWKVRKNMARGLGEVGKKVVFFDNAFHGRTGFALSATKSAVHKYALFPRFEWLAVRGPPCTSEGLGDGEMATEEARALGDVRRAIVESRGDVAAIILEPIQGEGGDVHWRREFLAGLRRVADELEAMLIYDEVQTGAGTTGKRWAFEHFGSDAVPDIVAFGKKTQVAGIMSTGRVDEVPDNVFAVSGRIDSTWGGNLTDFVRGQRILEIMEEEDLIGNSARVGEVMVGRLRELSAKWPLITRVRGRGLFIGATLPTPEVRGRFVKRALEEGLILMSCGTTSIRFRPPLVFRKEDVEDAIAILDRTCQAVFGSDNQQ
eukprot:m51a1_g3990 putative l-lysine 6-transaminase (460) ;mRNA; r:491094-492541